MICQHCGSIIPDGSRFCTECGTPVSAPEIPPVSVPAPETSFIPTGIPEPETEFIPTGVPEPKAEFIPTSIPEPGPDPEEAPEEILPDIPAVEIPTADIPAPEPVQSWSAPSSEPAASWSAPAPAPAAAPAAPAGNTFGYTEIGVGASAPGAAPPRPASPSPAPDDTKKSVFKQWWFWAAVAALVVLAIVLISSGGKGKGKDRPAPSAGEPSAAAVSVRESLNAHKAAASVGPMTYDEFLAYVEEYVGNRYASQGYQYFVEGEDDQGDIWIDAYLWRDDTFSTASDAFDGDTKALVTWIDLTNDLAEADAELYRVMEQAGLSGTVILNLVDQEDYDYLLAFMDEGEIVYDQVVGIDLWGFDDFEAEE